MRRPFFDATLATRIHSVSVGTTGHVAQPARNPEISRGAALRFSGYEGSFANAKADYDSSFLLTSFSEPRRLRWDEVTAGGTIPGTR